MTANRIVTEDEGGMEKGLCALGANTKTSTDDIKNQHDSMRDVST